MSLRGPLGPTTQRGKQKSRQNATKHGIFAVGIIPKRESEADYLTIVEDMAETLQPAGRLEEILVEKLAMLMWRYRRLLQAEAAEVARQTESDQEGKFEGEVQAAVKLGGGQGYIPEALYTHNKVAIQWAIEYLREIRQKTLEKGLDWERDRKALTLVYGSVKGQGEYGHHPLGLLASRYRELAGMGKDQQSATDVPRDAAKTIADLVFIEVIGLGRTLRDWRKRTNVRNRLQATAALVPRQEVTDRLQRYEGSLERSFDRTLSQLERLQRLRLGQPVLPALKVDVSH
jgi:hypothetical protein